jgi:lysosomal acid lipase/cholesteryl ester hydrolase
MIVNLL